MLRYTSQLILVYFHEFTRRFIIYQEQSIQLNIPVYSYKSIQICCHKIFVMTMFALVTLKPSKQDSSLSVSSNSKHGTLLFHLFDSVDNLIVLNSL